MIFLQILATLVGIFAVYLLAVATIPGISVPKQHLERIKPGEEAAEDTILARADVSFDVKGASLSAWLYLPKDLSVPVPCIIMGNGLGGTKDMGMVPYANRYRKAGFAVLSFDYRHFGESEGQPRQLIWIPSQLEDYLAAIKYVRSRKEIDPARIALWGTSLSGGHVIATAAKDKKVACVSAQCPWLDGFAAAKMGYKMQGIAKGIRLIMHGQRDLVRSWFGLAPHRIPIVGRRGSVAMLPFSEAYDFFSKLAPASFINEACARIMIRMDKYRPIKKARKVRCPVLLQICDNDEPLPLKVIERAAQKMGQFSEVKHYPIGHFDIYMGENFERSVSDQLAFFKRHL